MEPTNTGHLGTKDAVVRRCVSVGLLAYFFLILNINLQQEWGWRSRVGREGRFAVAAAVE